MAGDDALGSQKRCLMMPDSNSCGGAGAGIYEAALLQSGSGSVGTNQKLNPTAASKVKNHHGVDLMGNSKQNRKECILSPCSRPHGEQLGKQKCALQSPSPSIPGQGTG